MIFHTMRKTIMTLVLGLTAICGCSAGQKEQGQTVAAASQQTETTEQTESAQAEGKENPAPDFTLNDINGKPLALSSLRGKYVVLDFWGSWCVWCVRGVPKMKEYYEKYKDKMEILGMDCGDSEDDWKTAVKELGMPWQHVYVPEGSDLMKKFQIQGFPTKIILDQKGNIMQTVVGETPEFYEALDKLFGELKN